MSVTQTLFRAAVLDPDAERPSGLKDGQGRAAGRRFDVYRNNVAVSLSEALEAAFPVIRKLVGEENFKILASAFLRAHPPCTPLMMFYGAEMPEFLGDFGPTRGTGYLSDVARLELALRESYHAADADPVDPTALQALPAEDLMQSTITLAPSVRVIRSEWPVYSIWRYNTEADAPKPVMAAEDVLIARPELDPAPHLLPSGGGTFVAALSDGQLFGAAVEIATNASETFDLGAVLALLIETEAMTKIGD